MPGTSIRKDQLPLPPTSKKSQSCAQISSTGAHLAHCQLAVLAGCSTGLAAREQWIDRDSLVLPILYSGVPCVIASRWPVNSETTASLMQKFYHELLSGQTVPVAIHLAKESIRSNSQTGHPYFWASFDVYGNCNNES